MHITFKLVPKQSTQSTQKLATEILAKTMRVSNKELPVIEQSEKSLETVLYGEERLLNELIP